MRCYCCGRALNDYESTLKSAQSGEYLDTCMKCLDGLDIETVGRDDLAMFEEPTDDGDFDDESSDTESY